MPNDFWSFMKTFLSELWTDGFNGYVLPIVNITPGAFMISIAAISLAVFVISTLLRSAGASFSGVQEDTRSVLQDYKWAKIRGQKMKDFRRVRREYEHTQIKDAFKKKDFKKSFKK